MVSSLEHARDYNAYGVRQERERDYDLLREHFYDQVCF